MGVFPQQGKRVSANITYDSDGKYRWYYEMSLLKNPTIMFLIWKIFFFIMLGIFAFMVILGATESSDYFSEQFLGTLKIFGFILAGMTAIVALSYFIYAAIMGWKYCVYFEMDDTGVKHIQAPKQAAKAKKIGKAAAVIGVATHNYGAVGAGIGSQRTEMYSEFSKVRKVKPYPKRNLIKVNSLLNHNQVYAAAEDFEFVKNFIISKCVNLKN